MVTGKTAEATMASARRFHPSAAPDQIRRSQGVLALLLTAPNGDSWQVGGPAVAIRVNQ